MKADATSSHQNGFALISALVLITLLALLSLNGFRSALLESRLSITQQQRHMLFQQAESALRIAENDTLTQHLLQYGEYTQINMARQYDLPASVQFHGGDDASRRAPAIEIATLNRGGSLAVGRGPNSHDLHSTWVRVDATVFNRFDDPAVRLRSVVVRRSGE